MHSLMFTTLMVTAGNFFSPARARSVFATARHKRMVEADINGAHMHKLVVYDRLCGGPCDRPDERTN